MAAAQLKISPFISPAQLVEPLAYRAPVPALLRHPACFLRRPCVHLDACGVLGVNGAASTVNGTVSVASPLPAAPRLPDPTRSEVPFAIPPPRGA